MRMFLSCLLLVNLLCSAFVSTALAQMTVTRTDSNMEKKQFYVKSLPLKLRVLIGCMDYFADDGKLPESLEGFSTDLNGDGKDEYLFETNRGGNGGAVYAIFSKIKGEWMLIGDFQGATFSLDSIEKDRWSDINYHIHGGGGSWLEGTMCFSYNYYRDVFSESYDNRTSTETVNSLKALEAFWTPKDAIFSSLERKEEAFKPQAFPEKLVKLISGLNWNIGNLKTPRLLYGYSIDLNGDSKNEYILRSPWGNYLGPVYLVFHEDPTGEWRRIGSFQGEFFLMPAKNGWNPIVSIVGELGESYLKNCQEFYGDSYMDAWAESFDEGVIYRYSSEVLEFDKFWEQAGAIASSFTLKAHSLQTRKLNPDFKRVLAEADWGLGKGVLPEKVLVRLVDLNGDGDPEYIVKKSSPVPSLNASYLIISRSDDAWREIASFEGTFFVMPGDTSAWRPILAHRMMGSGVYVKSYLGGAENGYSHWVQIDKRYNKGLLAKNGEFTESDMKFMETPDGGIPYWKLRKQFFELRELPPQMQEFLAFEASRTSSDFKLPEKIGGFLADLNDDGKPEYILDNIFDTHTRFFMMNEIESCLVFREGPHGWTKIGEFKGSFYLLPQEIGWTSIISFEREASGMRRKIHAYFAGEYLEKPDAEESAVTSSTKHEAFSRVPGSMASSETLKEQKIPRGLLPFAMTTVENGEVKSSDKLTGYAIDLNGDGKNEYLVCDLGSSGSGGLVYRIFFQNKKGEWKEIGSFQGSFEILPLKNGWSPIISFSANGCDCSIKTLWELSNGEYRISWQEWLEKDKVTEKVPPRNKLSPSGHIVVEPERTIP